MVRTLSDDERPATPASREKSWMTVEDNERIDFLLDRISKRLDKVERHGRRKGAHLAILVAIRNLFNAISDDIDSVCIFLDRHGLLKDEPTTNEHSKTRPMRIDTDHRQLLKVCGAAIGLRTRSDIRDSVILTGALMLLDQSPMDVLQHTTDDLHIGVPKNIFRP